MRRSAGPDQLKAILIAFVIFGHTFVQPQVGDLGKWLIYGFHMPAFLFLSGYLLDARRLTSRPLSQLVAHYWRRMLAAWLAVSLVYLAVFDRGAYVTVPHLLRTLLLTPVWHLWYVPALFLAVLAAWVLSRNVPGRALLGVIALAGLVVFETPLGHQLLPVAVQADLDHRYLGYFVWFVLGLAVRNKWLRVPVYGWRLAAIVVGAAGWTLGFYGHDWMGDVGFIVLNLGAVLSVPTVLEWLSRPLPVIGGALTRIGKHSLWVYLLHPFITGPLQVPAAVPVLEQRAVGLFVTAGLLTAAAFITWPIERRNAPAQSPQPDQAAVAPKAAVGNL